MKKRMMVSYFVWLRLHNVTVNFWDLKCFVLTSCGYLLLLYGILDDDDDDDDDDDEEDEEDDE